MAPGTLTKKHAKKKKSLIRTNPNGANQWRVDPRQQTFLSLYIDPKSSTFSNAYQSAIKAGFSVAYAEKLMEKMPAWLGEKVGDLGMLQKAERNLHSMLDLPEKTQAMGAFGPLFERKKGKVKKAIMVHNTGLLKIKADVSKFVAERVGKKKYGPKDQAELPPLQTIIIINAPNGTQNRVHTVAETVGSSANS